MSEAQPPARIQVGSQPAPTIIVANSVFLLLCKIFKGSDCVSFISLFPQNLAQSRSQPMHVNVKHLCRHQQAKLAKKKKSEIQGEQDRGTLHHLFYLAAKTDGWNGTGRASRMTLGPGCLLRVSHLPGGAHAGVASVLTPPTSLPSFPSFLQELFPDTQHLVLLSQTLLEQKHRLLPTYA